MVTGGRQTLMLRQRMLVDLFGSQIEIASSLRTRPCIDICRPNRPVDTRIRLMPVEASALASLITVAELSAPDVPSAVFIGQENPVFVELRTEPAYLLSLTQEYRTLLLPSPIWARLAAELRLSADLFFAEQWSDMPLLS